MYCGTCKQEKPAESFHVDNRRKCKRQSRCKECVSAHSRSTYINLQTKHPETKLCVTCGLTKPASKFNSGNCKDGLKSECKNCIYWTRLSYRIDIKIQKAKELREAGANRCKICQEETSKLVLDHDHVTGRARGFICNPCNKGLGFFKDSISTLLSAIKYLNGEVA